MTRCIVNLAIGKRNEQSYLKGQARLLDTLNRDFIDDFELLRFYTNGYPIGSPTHQEIPFAFKAYALKEASMQANLLLWCDSCIVPIRSLQPIWKRAQEHGVWLGRNGFKNSDWTARETLPELFRHEITDCDPPWSVNMCRIVNADIEHVVATAFALDTDHPVGVAFLLEYFRLASETKAFCAPGRDPRTKHGVPVEGITHRHDQTAASVIAWRLGIPLTASPDLFAYRGNEDERTVLVADGSY